METKKQMQDALVKEVIEGNQTNVEKLSALTKEFVEYTLQKLGKTGLDVDLIVSDSISGVENMYHEGEYNALVVKNVLKAVVSSLQGDFLSFELPEKYSKGVSYQFRNILEENEKFIPATFGEEDFEYVWKFFDNLKTDQKILVLMYYVAEMSVEDIRNMTKARVFAISANLQFVKDKIKDRVVEKQMSPGGDFLSLSEKNIIALQFVEGLEGNKSATEEKAEPVVVVESKEEPKTEEKTAEIKSEPEVKEEPKEEKIEEPVKEDNEPDWDEVKPAPKPIKPEEAKKADKKKLPIIPIAVVIIIILLGVTAWKVISVYNDKNGPNPTTVGKKNEEDVKFNEKLSKAQEESVGDVDIMFTYNVLTAPKAEVNESISGQTYRLDMTFEMKDSEEKPVISLISSDLVEKYSAEKYKEAKQTIIDAGKESYYTFDDAQRTMTESRDWTPSDAHTASKYGEETANTWLSIMSGSLNKMSSSTDTCDLIPIMPSNTTVELNGKTYELVFYSAEGTYIQEDAQSDNDGSSKNYMIAAKAYLKEI